MKKLIYILLFILSISESDAQTDSFFKTYGSLDANSIDLTSDGGYIITGGSSLFKTNAFGDTLWTRHYYNIYGYHFHSVKQTFDGGYVLAGQVNEPDTTGELLSSVCVFRTDSNGDTLWTYTWNPASGDRAYSVEQTRDSNFIVAGVLDNSVNLGKRTSFLLKLDQNGDTLWSKTYEPYSNTKSVIQALDNGFILCGQKSYLIYLIKTDGSGDTIWTKMGGLGFQYGRAEDAVQLSDSSYIITGSVYHGSDQNVFVSKIDQNGNLMWTKEYGGSDDDYAQAMDVVNNDELIITGNTYSYASGQFTNSDVWLLRLDNNGDTLWTRTYGNEENNQSADIKSCSDGGFIICGNFPDSDESFLLKTDSLGNAPNILTISKIGNNNNVEINIYPNPAVENLTIELPSINYSKVTVIIYNLLGRKVVAFNTEIKNNSAQFDVDSLPFGVYNLTVIIDDSYSISKQFLKL